MAAIDVLNVNVDVLIEVMFKKRVDARMLKNKILYRVANIRYTKINIS